MDQLRGTLHQHSWIVKECGIWKIYIEVISQNTTRDGILQDFLWFTNFIKFVFDSSYDFSGVYVEELQVKEEIFERKEWLDLLEKLVDSYEKYSFAELTQLKTSAFSHFLTWFCLEPMLADFVLDMFHKPYAEYKKVFADCQDQLNHERSYFKWKEFYLKRLIIEFLIIVKWGKSTHYLGAYGTSHIHSPYFI